MSWLKDWQTLDLVSDHCKRDANARQTRKRRYLPRFCVAPTHHVAQCQHHRICVMQNCLMRIICTT